MKISVRMPPEPTQWESGLDLGPGHQSLSPLGGRLTTRALVRSWHEHGGLKALRLPTRGRPAPQCPDPAPTHVMSILDNPEMDSPPEANFSWLMAIFCSLPSAVLAPARAALQGTPAGRIHTSSDAEGP